MVVRRTGRHRRIAFETGMTEDEVKEHLNVLEQQDGKVALDDGSCGGGLSILVVNFIKHQCTTSPKLVMSLRALFRGVESEKIRAVLIAKNPHLLDGMDTVSGTLSIRSGEIDQDQIQENKKREEIRSFPCSGGDEERGKRGRQGKGDDIVAPLLPPQLLNTDTPKQDRKGYVQYTPPSASPFPLAVAVEVDDRLQDIPLDLLEACNGTIQPSTFQRRLIGLGNGLGTIRHPRSLYATHGVSSRHG